MKIYLCNQKLIDRVNNEHENLLNDIKLESPDFIIKNCNFDDLASIMHEKSSDKKFIYYFDNL